MKERIEQYIKGREQLKAELKIWVLDESIPLDERWEVFLKSDLGKDDWGVCIPEEHYQSAGYDWDKYQTFDVGGFYQQLIEHDSDGKYDKKLRKNIPHDEPFFDEQARKEFKQFYLKCFVKSFKYDW